MNIYAFILKIVGYNNYKTKEDSQLVKLKK